VSGARAAPRLVREREREPGRAGRLTGQAWGVSVSRANFLGLEHPNATAIKRCLGSLRLWEYDPLPRLKPRSARHLEPFDQA